MIAKAAIVPPYFALRVGCGLLLLKLATSWLPREDFALFAQFGLFAATVNFLCGGALQSGLVRAAASVRDDTAALAGIQAAAAWLIAGPCVLVALCTVAGARLISLILAGSEAHGWAVVGLTLACLLGTPGQLWCGILTGRGKIGASLSSQGLGLASGTIVAAARLAHGDAAGAAIGLAMGGLVTTTLAFGALRVWRLPRAPRRPSPSDVAMLARFSFAVGGSYGLASAGLFGLRFLYRQSQGALALSYWLAASRISDMSTQLLGLMMAQVVLPELAGRSRRGARRAVLLRGGTFGVAVAGLALLTFLVGARPIVSTFLSPPYIAAIPAIALYLSGDVLRVVVSLAQQVNLADDKLGRYAMIELGAPIVLAGAVAIVPARDGTWAPEIGYLGAYALLAALVLTGARRRGFVSMVARTRAETV